jgi:hypothetical protein
MATPIPTPTAAETASALNWARTAWALTEEEPDGIRLELVADGGHKAIISLTPEGGMAILTDGYNLGARLLVADWKAAVLAMRAALARGATPAMRGQNVVALWENGEVNASLVVILSRQADGSAHIWVDFGADGAIGKGRFEICYGDA